MKPGCDSTRLSQARKLGYGSRSSPASSRAVRVPEHGDVGDRVSVADEELALGQVVVQQLQHFERAGAPLFGLGMIRRPATDEQPETQAADHEHDVRLLVDQPAHDLRALPRVVRQVAACRAAR